MSDDLPGLESILDDVAELAELFESGGASLYLVGGVVRDLLLGLPVSGDLDFTTSARPPQIRELITDWADAVWSQGERFGTIGAHRGDQVYEITTFRAEAYDPTSRKPNVTFGDDIDVDLSRRDFTVNAMAVEAATSALIDPHGGRADLESRVLRTPLAPKTSFSDDPLRMLRAARFVARLGLAPDASIVDAIETMTDRLAIVSAERIHDELWKLLAVADPAPGLRLLLETGLAEQVWPQLVAEALPAIDAVAADPVARFVVGMMFTPQPLDAVDERSTALKLSGAERRRARSLVNDLHALRELDARRDADVRRWVRSAAGDRDTALSLARVVPELKATAESLTLAIDRVGAVEDLDRLDIEVPGELVIERLGVAPGPIVGEAIEHLQEVRLDHGPLTEEQLLEHLDEWWRKRQA